VDAPENDGNASMPEQVKRHNPWRRRRKKKKKKNMMMMMMINDQKPYSTKTLILPYNNYLSNACLFCAFLL
jgi:uncharacterized protein (DUF1919 family)